MALTLIQGGRGLAGVKWGAARWTSSSTYQDALGHTWGVWQVPEAVGGDGTYNAFSNDYTTTFASEPSKESLALHIDSYVASVTPTEGVPPPYVPPAPAPAPTPSPSADTPPAKSSVSRTGPMMIGVYITGAMIIVGGLGIVWAIKHRQRTARQNPRRRRRRR